MAKSLAREQEFSAASAPAIATGRAIDLVHLARQSLSDRALEVELLGLFTRQSEQIMERLASDLSGSDRRWRHDLAHTLKGSARAVGAGKVAMATEAYEEALYAGRNEDEQARCIEQLSACVREAQAAIKDLLPEA
ncbi:MAG: Hpt domain-containing protein [Alphaproteobacteria bacterium]|nr:Hpt domain-containing protein [Alphaproteobacteria bacterium]